MHKRAYNILMSIEWDPRKAAANSRKHGVSFEDASAVLYDEFALTVEDPHRDEERFATLGLDAIGRLVVVVYTWRGETIRVISARRATARERRAYAR